MGGNVKYMVVRSPLPKKPSLKMWLGQRIGKDWLCSLLQKCTHHSAMNPFDNANGGDYLMNKIILFSGFTRFLNQIALLTYTLYWKTINISI